MNRVALFALLLTVTASTPARSQGLFNYDFDIVSLGNGVNSVENDYAPALSPDRSVFYFTSYRSASALGEADIWISRGRSTRDWNQPINPGSPLNSEGNEGSITVAGNGRTCVFAADSRDDGYGDTDIYFAELVEGRITNIRNAGGLVNSSGWDSQPSISADGKRIYFASNRKGGQGGTDIYVSTLTGADWSAPINMGNAINSSRNERSPYITLDGGTLFFASNGIAGFGGYDLFMSISEQEGWDQPSNLGSQINSDGDELFFTAPSKGEGFYFSSSRSGGMGGLDIYAGTPNVFGSGMFKLTVSVLDSATRKPLPSIVAVVDAARGDTIATFTTNMAAAEYDQVLPADRTYQIIATVQGQAAQGAQVTAGGPNTSQKVELLYSGIQLAEFNLGKYYVPFFVTGYYRPNTHRNLEELHDLLEGPLADAKYIEHFHKNSRKYQQYSAYADAIEVILNTVVRTTTDDLIPRFKVTAQPGEMLEITITGYADPQPFVGEYVESETVSFVDAKTNQVRTLEQGDRIENLELSGLRAWFAGKQVREQLLAESGRGNKEFEDLLAGKRVVFRIVAGGESLDSKNLAAQRRIHIAMRIVGGARGDEEVDFNEKLK